MKIIGCVKMQPKDSALRWFPFPSLGEESCIPHPNTVNQILRKISPFSSFLFGKEKLLHQMLRKMGCKEIKTIFLLSQNPVVAQKHPQGQVNLRHTVFFGKEYWSRGVLFAVCSNPKMEKPSRFFFSKKSFMLHTGTSMRGTHFSAVTLSNKQSFDKW